MQCCGYCSQEETKLAVLASCGLCVAKASSLGVDIVMTKPSTIAAACQKLTQYVAPNQLGWQNDV